MLEWEYMSTRLVSNTPRALFFAVVVSALTSLSPAAPRQHEPKMSWLDNGTIRFGADLNLGGAITWLSKSGDETNVINSFDWGRQVQMSYYGGPVPFVVGKKKPAKQWMGLGWNPIQAGDDFGNRSQVLDHRNDGKTMYVKCVPMQWPLEAVPGECVFEAWFELEGTSVKARCRLSNSRTDRTAYPARGQELPAVYTNGPFHQLMTYSGEKPFTHDALTTIAAKGPNEGWSHWLATERWSALVNDEKWGLGVWNPDCVRSVGGFNGKPGGGGPKDDACGYIAPTRMEILDHHIVHEYHYELILGSLDEIRAHVYKHSGKPTLPTWKFERDRDGWYYRNATDKGLPVRSGLDVQLDGRDPWIMSPVFATPAAEASTLVIEAAFKTTEPNAQLYWADVSNQNFTEARSVHFPVNADGEMHEYRLRLADNPEYKGTIIQFRFDPANEPGGSVRVKSVRMEK